jgi:hypothetical protein
VRFSARRPACSRCRTRSPWRAQAPAPLRACFLRVLTGWSSLARSPMPCTAELALRTHLLLLQLPRTLRSVAARAPAPASMAGRELQLNRLRCSPTLAAVPLSLLARVDVPSARSYPSPQLPACAKLSARRRFSPARSVPARRPACLSRTWAAALPGCSLCSVLTSRTRSCSPWPQLPGSAAPPVPCARPAARSPGLPYTQPRAFARPAPDP